MAFTRQVRFELEKYSPNLKGSFILLNTKGTLAETEFQMDMEVFKMKSAELRAKYIESRTDKDRLAYFENEKAVANVIIDLLVSSCAGGEIKDGDQVRPPQRQDFEAMDNEMLSDLISVVFNGLEKK